MIRTVDDVVAYMQPLSTYTPGDIVGLIEMSERNDPELPDVIAVYESQGRAASKTVWQGLDDLLETGSELAIKLAPILGIVLSVAPLL
jgi:hypothetical protein